jgi:hypothetical protein
MAVLDTTIVNVALDKLARDLDVPLGTVLGLALIIAFNAFYWLPIRGESPARMPAPPPQA